MNNVKTPQINRYQPIKPWGTGSPSGLNSFSAVWKWILGKVHSQTRVHQNTWNGVWFNFSKADNRLFDNNWFFMPFFNIGIYLCVQQFFLEHYAELGVIQEPRWPYLAFFHHLPTMFKILITDNLRLWTTLIMF